MVPGGANTHNREGGKTPHLSCSVLGVAVGDAALAHGHHHKSAEAGGAASSDPASSAQIQVLGALYANLDFRTGTVIPF